MPNAARRRAPRPTPTTDAWRVRVSRPRATDVPALRATLCWHDRPVAHALWNPHDPSGRLLWTDDGARDAFTALAAELATHAVPTCRRPLRDEAANQLMIWLAAQATDDVCPVSCD